MTTRKARAKAIPLLRFRNDKERDSKCRSFDCASRDETARAFAQDDTLLVEGKGAGVEMTFSRKPYIVISGASG